MKVLIADDHPLALAALQRALTAAGLDVVAAVRSGSEVLPRVAQTEPDVVLLDVRLPEVDGMACLERLRSRDPDVDVVMFSASSDVATVESAQRLGARAYIVKTLSGGDIASALREVVSARDFRFVGEELEPPDDEAAGLTAREMSMLETLARGLSNRAIGRELWITEQTVKFHLTNIYRKLGVENRTQAVRYAYEYGLVAGTADAAAR